MANSKLVVYTKLSPNHSGARTHKIDRITPHCVVGQCTVETIGSIFEKASAKASCNYGIGPDGKVGMYVEEGNRSWCSSNAANDQRAVTIECASEKEHPYTMKNEVYESLVNLCTEVCRRHSKKKLLWFGDKDKTLKYEPKADEMVITVHRWFAKKACPGDWLYERLGDLANRVTANLGGTEQKVSSKLVAADLKNLTDDKVVSKVGSLFTEDQKKSGILASVSMAQFILESSYGKSELAQMANNCFGMKTSLSGNTWSGSTWDGKSKYTKKTQEEYKKGVITTIEADFRKYPCIEDAIADHSAYLNGAKNGTKLRYAGLKGCTDPKKVAQIIKDGGYATSSTYVEKLCAVIDKWNLTQFDVKITATPIAPAAKDTGGFPNTPFVVKVLINNLNYRADPHMTGRVKGQTGVGNFTIVEVKNGWGRLKSGAGWIYLENPKYCKIL